MELTGGGEELDTVKLLADRQNDKEDKVQHELCENSTTEES